MKKTILFFISVVLLLTAILASCNESWKSMDSCGKEIISLMNEMVNCEEYLKIYNLPSSFDDTVSQIKNGDYSNPSAVYKLSVPADALMQVDTDLDKLSTDLKEYVHSATYVSFATRINQSAGSTSLAVASALSAQKSFMCEGIKDPTVLLYIFDSGYPIVVSFIPGESGSSRAIGYFLINDNFMCGSTREIEESCAIAGIKGVEAKKK